MEDLDSLLREAGDLIQATVERDSQKGNAPPPVPAVDPTPPSAPAAIESAEAPPSGATGDALVRELVVEVRGLRQRLDRLTSMLEARGPGSPGGPNGSPPRATPARVAALPATDAQKAQWAAEGLPVLESPQSGTTGIAHGVIVGEDGIPDLDFQIPRRNP